MGLLSNKHVAIVGGAGFIGSHLTDKVIDEAAAGVVVIDNLFLGETDNLKGAIKNGAVFYRDDGEFYSSLQYIFDKHPTDIVFNCATKALNYSFVNPSSAFSTNVSVILNLLELQRRQVFGTLCHISTSEVYGTAICEPMDENHPINPLTTYAAGKAAADLALKSYVNIFDINAAIVRPFNNYGPRQNRQGYMAGVIPATINRVLHGLPLSIDGDGTQSRDFVYVADTVRAIVEVFGRLQKGEVVNVATGKSVQIREIVSTIACIMGYRGEITYQRQRTADVLCHTGSNKKLSTLVSFPLTPLDEGLTRTVNWYVSLGRGQ
ncbi:MAG: NAD-dependent epimerase/dehydratase family protein [Nitrospirae bacterium]|nr:NAD-dependent epimerase/dehydratase family protein [Nitrospirota bacterium]